MVPTKRLKGKSYRDAADVAGKTKGEGSGDEDSPKPKAKQTKVARELKYHSPTWDPSRLEQDLRGGTSAPTHVDDDVEFDDDADDEYADPYAEDDDAPPSRRR